MWQSTPPADAEPILPHGRPPCLGSSSDGRPTIPAVTSSTAGFDAASTTDDVLEGVDLDGEVVLVTGASAGLGLETVRALADRGATVVAAVRDVPKAQAALASAGVEVSDRVTLEEVDLASLASVRAFTDRFAASRDRLDVLVANAGLMACPQGTTADGFELQFGTNHLGHFVMVNRLVPLLLDSSPSRVVVLTSAAHHIGDVDLDDPGFETTPYNEWLAYGRSKTANAQYAVELDRRLADRGVRAVAVHPGTVDTELVRHLDEEALAMTAKSGGTQKTVEVGAATQVWAGFVADAAEVGGRYVLDCCVAEPVDDWDPQGVRSYVVDPDRGARLWSTSEAMVDETFSW